jgi:hypothetical protein
MRANTRKKKQILRPRACLDRLEDWIAAAMAVLFSIFYKYYF